MAEGARFENAPGPETTGRDLPSSVESQSVADELEADENRSNTMEDDSSATV